MLTTSTIKYLSLTEAVITVELKYFDALSSSSSSSSGQVPYPSTEQLFLVGIDLISGAVNVSSGLQQGITRIDPIYLSADRRALEQSAVRAVLEWILHLEWRAEIEAEEVPDN